MRPNSVEISVSSALISPHKLAPFPSSAIPHFSTLATFSLLSGLEAVCTTSDLELLVHCLVQTEVLASWLLPSKRSEFHQSFSEPGTGDLDFFPLGDRCTSISFNFACLKFKIRCEKEKIRGVKKSLGKYTNEAFFLRSKIKSNSVPSGIASYQKSD